MRITVILLLWLTFNAKASLIELKAEGTVSQIDPIFEGLVDYGDKMSATFVYSPLSIVSSNEFAPHRVFYYLSDFSFQIEMGALYVSGGGGRIEVTNDYGDPYGRTWDRFILESASLDRINANSLTSIFNVANLSIGMVLYDYSETDALTSSDLPSIISLDKFSGPSYVTLQMNLDNGVFNWLPMFANIRSSQIRQISEPSSMVLFIFTFPWIMRRVLRKVCRQSPFRFGLVS